MILSSLGKQSSNATAMYYGKDVYLDYSMLDESEVAQIPVMPAVIVLLDLGLDFFVHLLNLLIAR
jgi:hypothetical protein